MKELIPIIVDGVVRILNTILRRKRKRKKNGTETPTGETNQTDSPST